MPRSLPLLLAVLLAGCLPKDLVRDAPEAGQAAGFPDHSTEQIIAAVEASVAPVLSAAADGDLAITSPDGDQQATFSLRARLADSVTVTVRGPLGVVAGRALVTPDSVFVVNTLSDQILIGPIDFADTFVPGASVDGRIGRAALGLLVPERDVAWTRTVVDGTYRLTGSLPGGGGREYTVDPSIWRVVQVREFGPDRRQVGVQTVEAFDTVDGVVMPRRVTLQSDDGSAVLEHRRLLVNPPDLRLRFVRPEGYEVIRR